MKKYRRSLVLALLCLVLTGCNHGSADNGPSAGNGPATDKNPASDAFNDGIACQRRGDPNRAISSFTEAIRLKPDYAEAYCARGVSHNAKGERDKAIGDFTEAIRGNRAPRIDGAEARAAVAVVTAIYRSAREGRPISLATP